jgi:prepilin-type N-terminal cleavage/methylation domain-containing protein
VKPLRPLRFFPPRLQPGFTLVELTIVMLIVSILLAGILMPLSLQMELRRYADTKKTMDQINEALIGFVLINGRLPCPADRAVADGTAGAGTELLSGNACSSITGVIPWVTLNVPETDEWGGRFTYRVTSAFADAIVAATYGCAPSVSPTQSSFALCDNGDMKIRSRATNGTPYDVTNVALPAVYISHGKNGYGAYGSNGIQIPRAPSNTDEYANSSSTAVIFFSREKADAVSGCNDTANTPPLCEFDDLVAFIPLTTLMNRMVVSGKLP